MAITAIFNEFEQLKGPYHSGSAQNPLHLVRRTLLISGSYATGGFVVDLTTPMVSTWQLGTLAQGQRMALSFIVVNGFFAYGDYGDGTVAATVSNANSTLSSGGATTNMSAASTGNLLTLKLYTGANGIGGAELPNLTVLAGGALTFCTTETWSMGALGNV